MFDIVFFNVSKGKAIVNTYIDCCLLCLKYNYFTHTNVEASAYSRILQSLRIKLHYVFVTKLLFKIKNVLLFYFYLI